jgi:hypothetical protein
MNPTLQLDRESYGCRYPVADLACSCAWPVVIVIPPAYCHHIANTDYVRGNISSSVDTAYRIQTLATEHGAAEQAGKSHDYICMLVVWIVWPIGTRIFCGRSSQSDLVADREGARS